jgi:hypothetical protein
MIQFFLQLQVESRGPPANPSTRKTFNPFSLSDFEWEKRRLQKLIKCWETGLPDFSWSKHTITAKIYQTTTSYTNGHTLYQMAVNIPNGHYIWQHFPFQGPPNFTQIVIFGLKINHLATLVGKREKDVASVSLRHGVSFIDLQGVSINMGLKFRSLFSGAK